jgi:hypothetical protein
MLAETPVPCALNERRKSLLPFAHDLSSGRFHITPTDEKVVELLLNGGVDIKRPRCIFGNALQVAFVRWGIATGHFLTKQCVSIPILRHAFESCKPDI